MAAPVPPPRHELFIYYRVSPAHTDALAAAVGEMQSRLCHAHAGLSARLLCRPDPREGQQTWMETYRLPVGADAVSLAAAIEQAAQPLQARLAGPRHVEHFVECAS